MKTIALDFDGTYTAAPELWDKFIELFKTKFNLICVTMRYDNDDERITHLSIPVYYTARKAKAPHMAALGIDIKIWIDDNPMWIFYEAKG